MDVLENSDSKYLLQNKWSLDISTEAVGPCGCSDSGTASSYGTESGSSGAWQGSGNSGLWQDSGNPDLLWQASGGSGFPEAPGGTVGESCVSMHSKWYVARYLNIAELENR